jgi:CheY-like chemotaxis protein
MTGLELYKKIMSDDLLRVRRIPFIFLTTSSDSQTIAKAFEMPVQGFFVKPSSIPELKDMMRMIIDYWKICRYPV